MNFVKMKIMGYDDESHSVLVAFASDTTKSQDPTVYPVYAFQPLMMWPDVTDIEEIKKRMAVAGLYHTEQQRAKEEFLADDARVSALKGLVGYTATYQAEELLAPEQTPYQTV